MKIATIDPRDVDCRKIPRRPWWCARCKCEAHMEAWRDYGVCDPCALVLHRERQAQAERAKAKAGAR